MLLIKFDGKLPGTCMSSGFAITPAFLFFSDGIATRNPIRSGGVWILAQIQSSHCSYICTLQIHQESIQLSSLLCIDMLVPKNVSPFSRKANFQVPKILHFKAVWFLKTYPSNSNHGETFMRTNSSGEGLPCYLLVCQRC